jgi:hypothetical protein
MTVTPKLAFVTTIGTVAYVGLAVLGWGGFAEFFLTRRGLPSRSPSS